MHKLYFKCPFVPLGRDPLQVLMHIYAPHIYKPRMWAKMICAHTTTYMYISTLLFHLNMTFALRIFYDYLSLMFLIVDRYIVSLSSHGVINNSTCLPPNLGHFSVLKNEGKNV